MSTPNPELRLAHDFVEHTNLNIFLTGKAGTGKTTFLHNLKKNTPKRMIVTAPTGVAAINAGGVTLHSFFQMPFGPFVPGSEAHEHQNLRRFRKEKTNIIKSLDLLVIDEISMVRADLLDGVDAVLRRYRRSEQPFGGVQLLMIGDLHQLSPVVKDAEWNILRQYYNSPYFFDSQALAKTELIPIELKHIYRQSDIEFIKLLNRVRDNRLDPATLEQLNSRYQPDFTPPDKQGYITLCTHNSGADTINNAKLRALQKKPHHFRAAVEGEFPEHTYPTPAMLELKEGAQVMFTRNDASGDQRYFNGKIGKITRISGKTIHVKCPEENEEIKVEQAVWENINYQLDEETKEIKEKIVGTFVQYPLKPAWAITIHKSQGLTFEKAVIDAQAAFAHGQVYVALSRCKTFEGMVLSSRITSNAVKTDELVFNFTKNACENPPTREQLEAAKISYQRQLLLECFDFNSLRFRLNRLARVLMYNAQNIRVSGVGEMNEVERRTSQEINGIGENFQRQLTQLFADDKTPESDPVILERVTKASAYFQEKLETILGDPARNIQIETDNKEIRKRARYATNQLQQEFAVKSAAVKSCENGFSPARYLRALSAAEIDFKPDTRKKSEAAQYTASDIDHPEMFQSLKDWRSAQAAEEDIAHFRILHQSVLIQIAVTLPDNLLDLKKIKGVGKRTIEKYGKDLIRLVTEYRKKHDIQEVVPPEPKAAAEEAGEVGSGEQAEQKPKQPKINSKQVSFDMFKAGLSISQIAEDRGFVTSTIEGHLTSFVESGELEIGKLLSAEQQRVIEEKVNEMKENSLGEIKGALGDEYSYGQIKLVLAHRKFLENRRGEGDGQKEQE